MYSVGEEFERLVEEDLEYLTCISNVTIGDKEYLICENENGTKRLFYYDTVEENLELLEEEEADEVLEVWEEEYYGSDKEYMYWNEEFGEYDKIKDENESFSGLEEIEDGESEDILADFEDDLGGLEEEEDLDEFLNSFLDE